MARSTGRRDPSSPRRAGRWPRAQPVTRRRLRRSASAQSRSGVSWLASAVQKRNVAVLAHGRTRVALAESAVVGMVLHERVLIALHRLAQEDASSRYFG